MNEDMSGIIKHRERALQVHDFSGLRFCNGTPTDLDAFLDFREQLFNFLEFKSVGAPMPEGQHRGLTRLCKVTARSVPSYLLHCEHNHPVDEDIKAGEAQVLRYYVGHKQRWIKPRSPISAHDAVALLSHSFLDTPRTKPVPYETPSEMLKRLHAMIEDAQAKKLNLSDEDRAAIKWAARIANHARCASLGEAWEKAADVE